MSNGWIAVDKSSGAPRIIRKIDKIEDKVQKHLTQLNELDVPLKTEYKKRKLIQEM
jgi:phenylalanyl-tRNA synthetase alpha chain